MTHEEIHQIIEHQAKLKCGELWNSMNDKERNRQMLKMAIVIIEDYFSYIVKDKISVKEKRI